MTFRELASAYDRAYEVACAGSRDSFTGNPALWHEFVVAEDALLAALKAAGKTALIGEGRVYLESAGMVIVLDCVAAADDPVPEGAAKNPG